MTSNFALSLSFEGIRLLQRVPGGWHHVGDVALDSPDLAADLADLRAKGLQLDPGGLRTKLLIPDSQIKYLTIDSAQTSLEDVHQALDGATPYALDDLVIDFDRTGGRTYIAAVARETLDEAEAFAADHDFAPVSFAAIPEPLTFRAEVFFGAAKGARDIVGDAPVERDEEPVKVIGDAVFPSLVEEDEGLPVFLKSASRAGAAAPVDAPAAQEEPQEDAAEENAASDEAAPAAEVVFASRNRVTSDGDDAADAAEATGEAVEEAFETTDDAPPAAPEPTEEAAEPAPEPLFARRKEPPELAVPTGMVDGPAIDPVPDDVPEAPKPIVAEKAPPVAAPPLTGSPDDAPAAGFSSKRTPQIIPAAPKPAPFVPTIHEPEVEEVAARAPLAAPTSEPTPAEPDGPEMAVFGTRKKPTVGGKPRFLGLKLTAGLLLFLLLVALWANTLDDDGIAGLFRSDAPAVAVVPDTPAEEVTVAAAPVIETQPLVEETPAPSALAPETIMPEPEAETPLPIVRAPTGRVLSPAEADRIYAATGVYQRAPRMPLIPRAATLDDFTQYAALPLSTRPDQLTLPAIDAMLPDPLIAQPRNPPPPDVKFPRDLRGFILATPEGTVTPDGVLVIAGAPELRPPLRPGTEAAAPEPQAEVPVVASPALDADTGIILVAGRPPLVPPLRPDGLAPQEDAEVTVQEEEATETDVAAAESASPADPDAIEESLAIDASQEASPETELVTTDDALTADAAAIEEALAVVEGSPDVTPPDRPDGAALPADDVADVVNPTDAVTPGGVSLASFRPSLRPASILENAPAPIFSDPALAAFRPSLRPEGLGPAEEEAPDEPDLNAVIAAIAEAAPESAFQNVTARAISASPRPDTRPRNFNQVVARAQAAAARQQTQAATTASAPAAAARPAQVASNAAVQPTGPVPGGVAQAATIDNAIRLRDMNLIGVYGRPNARRALVRLGNGRYVKVEVGSSLDGGRVTAIGDSALNFVKSGRTYALQLPRS